MSVAPPSPLFLVYLATFFATWSIVRATARPAAAHLLVVAASFGMYGAEDWRYPFLLAAIAAIAFFATARLRTARLPGVWLAIAILPSLGVLATFRELDIGALGLSFFLFHVVSYSIDVHRGRCEPTRNFVLYLAYLALFPRLLAGPVTRARRMLPQLAALPRPTEEMRWRGTQLFAIGVFKKLVVADRLGGVVDFYDRMAEIGLLPADSSPLWWFVAIAYVFRLYADISGWLDIARGLGLWMGLELPRGFERPLQAGSLRGFWYGWNASVSSWFRAYVWFPIRRRWRSRLGFHVACVSTFVVFGLWHGITYPLLAFGLAHGVLFSIEHATGWSRRLSSLPGGRIVACLVVFGIVVVTFVALRARSFDHLLSMLATMFSTHTIAHHAYDFPIEQSVGWWILPAVYVLGHVLLMFGADRWRWATARWTHRLAPIGVALLLVITIMGRAQGMEPFFYERL
jgi:D-alanyl-lipoteichoic acid acyltransferase DltB (MBOAT superfamily)